MSRLPYNDYGPVPVRRPAHRLRKAELPAMTNSSGAGRYGALIVRAAARLGTTNKIRERT